MREGERQTEKLGPFQTKNFPVAKSNVLDG